MWISLIQFTVKLNGCTLLRKWKSCDWLDNRTSWPPYLFLLSVNHQSDQLKQPEMSVSCRWQWSHIAHHWTTWHHCGAFSHFFNCFRKWGRVTKFRKLRVAINITEQRAKAAERSNTDSVEAERRKHICDAPRRVIGTNMEEPVSTSQSGKYDKFFVSSRVFRWWERPSKTTRSRKNSVIWFLFIVQICFTLGECFTFQRLPTLTLIVLTFYLMIWCQSLEKKEEASIFAFLYR